MATFSDIIFTDDVQVVDGDFLINESDEQHIEHIFRASKGQIRQWPLVGLSIAKQQNGTINRQSLKQEIRTQLKADSYAVRRIDIDGSLNVSVDAKRIK